MADTHLIRILKLVAVLSLTVLVVAFVIVLVLRSVYGPQRPGPGNNPDAFGITFLNDLGHRVDLALCGNPPVCSQLDYTYSVDSGVTDQQNIGTGVRTTWLIFEHVEGIARAISFGAAANSTGAGPLDWWETKISDISNVRVAQRSILIRSKTGDCSFGIPRYFSSTREKMLQIMGELDRLQVPQERVESNFWARIGMNRGQG
jgi:hypothetical protein